jgi:YegS/Rv2252/BmrU family lipid kinase
MKAVLIVNPAAGRGSASEDALALTARLSFAAKYETSATNDARACARRALADGAEVILAAGGDGTISLVADAVVGTDVALGIIPCGTSNSIATTLGITLEDAARTILGGHVRRIDTATVNGRTMLLHASLGFHARTVGATAQETKSRFGELAYVAQALSAIGEMDPFEVTVTTPEHVIRCRATNVAVANAAPVKTVLAQGPGHVDPRDGELDVTIVAATGLAEAVATGLHLLRSALRGEPATRENVGYLSARKVHVETSPPQPVLIDGEPAGEGRLDAECRSRSLSVLVPG